MTATMRLVILTALRDRLFIAFFGLLAVATALAFFLGGASLSEQLQMAIVFAAGGGRLLLVLGLTIFAAFHIQALFETREIEAILARAISRPQFILGYWLGMAAVALVLAGCFSLAIILIAGVTKGAFAWAISLILECIIVLAVVVFAGLMLERATTTALFTIGFYALARLMGFFIGIRAVADETPLNAFVKKGLDTTLLIVPRLDLFSQTHWLIYGASFADIRFVWLQSALFIALALLAATVDLQRKQF